MSDEYQQHLFAVDSIPSPTSCDLCSSTTFRWAARRDGGEGWQCAVCHAPAVADGDGLPVSAVCFVCGGGLGDDAVRLDDGAEVQVCGHCADKANWR